MKRSLNDSKETPPCKKTGLLDMPNEIIADIIKTVPRPAPLFYTCRRLYEFAHHMSAADAYDLMRWHRYVLKSIEETPNSSISTAKSISEDFDDLYLATQLAVKMGLDKNFAKREFPIVKRWAKGLQSDYINEDEIAMWYAILSNTYWKIKSYTGLKNALRWFQTKIRRIVVGTSMIKVTWNSDFEHFVTPSQCCRHKYYWMALVIAEMLPKNMVIY